MNKAANIANLSWIQDGRKAKFQCANAYGVLNNKGQALSKDGTTPSTWTTLKVAKEIAMYADGFKGFFWIDVS